jgi:UTP:GlnB (protein PII) uridylyltransferase
MTKQRGDEQMDMEQMVQVHKAMGLSDQDSEEIAEIMRDLMRDTGKITEALELLTEKYDAKTLLIGMRMMQLMDLNMQMIASGRPAVELARRVQDPGLN